jgi:SAM-dependent methyltransferase
MGRAEMLKWYDKAMLNPVQATYFGGSDFYNLGYWAPDCESQAEASAALVEKLLSFIPDKRGNILDVGCGLGATTRTLLEYYDPKDIVAINISEVQLNRARQNAPGVDFRFMDAANLDFPDNHFDNIICVDASYHFVTRERFLREALRVLKPGGRLVESDVLFTPRATTIEYLNLPTANYVATPDEFRDILLGIGFAEANVHDAKRECLDPFIKNHLVWPGKARKAGKLPFGGYLLARFFAPSIARNWKRLADGYVLIEARKATNDA